MNFYSFNGAVQGRVAEDQALFAGLVISATVRERTPIGKPILCVEIECQSDEVVAMLQQYFMQR